MSCSSGSGAATSPRPASRCCYAGLGDTAETFAWLRRALEARDPCLIYNFVNDPVMAPFRRDPRGQAILRAMGLAER